VCLFIVTKPLAGPVKDQHHCKPYDIYTSQAGGNTTEKHKGRSAKMSDKPGKDIDGRDAICLLDDQINKL
jgi:hypothetical protein